MLRVGYPAILSADLFHDFPADVKLVPLADGPGPEVDIDVWLPDPYPTRAMKVWPRLRGVKLVLSLMAGTEWIPRTVGPACDDLQCTGCAQYFYGRVGRFVDSGDVEVFSVLP